MDRHDHWLASFFLAIAGIYVLFVGLALAELASARWGIWLVLGAVACFGAALALGAGGVRRMLEG